MSNQIAQNYARQIDEDMQSLIEQLRTFEPGELYTRPFPEEWSVQENMAHIAEFPPYWLKEFLKIIEKPGQPFGRTHTDPDRISAVADHAQDEQALTIERLERARAETLEMLSKIEDDQWEKTGVHQNRGVMTLHQMMEFFVTKHLRDHVEQAKAALQAVKEK